MRYFEFAINTTEGRNWTSTDDLALLDAQIGLADNTRALNIYAPDVHITNAVKLIADRADSKWFFDFMANKLHALEAEGVDVVYFFMNKDEDEWHIWAVDDFGHQFEFPAVKGVTFAADEIGLRAVNKANFWQVSFNRD